MVTILKIKGLNYQTFNKNQLFMNYNFRVLYTVLMLSYCFITACDKAAPTPEEVNYSSRKASGGSGGTGTTGTATYSGQATALDVNALGITTILGQTPALQSAGGCEKNSLLTASVLNVLSAGVLHAATIGQGDRTRSEASVAGLNLNVLGIGIQAGLLSSRTTASCGGGATGVSEIVGLIINGKAITITGKPNQTLDLIVAKIVINEQIVSGGYVTVNALHITAVGLDIKIASSFAGIACSGGSPNCDGGNFVTGGGFINYNNAKANFAVAGGLKKDNTLWGHLNYQDHGSNGIKVKGTGVKKYVVVNATTRRIEGTCEINGVSGTYIAIVTDNGEPGRNDIFNLQLSNGYHASGNLGGGNIQLHVPCK